MVKDTKEKILATALELFSQNGYAGTNTSTQYCFSNHSRPLKLHFRFFQYQDYATFIPLQVCEGVDVMMGGVMGYYNAPDEVIKDFKKMSQMDVQQMGSECMSTWYGIQTTPEAIHRA